MNDLNTPNQQVPRLSAFLIVNGSEIHLLEKASTTIGRRGDNDLVIDNIQISRHHARIDLSEDDYILIDLNSTGGTSVNGLPVSSRSLEQGDAISIAGTPMIFGRGAADPAIAANDLLSQAESKKASLPTQAVDALNEPASLNQFLDLMGDGDSQTDDK